MTSTTALRDQVNTMCKTIKDEHEYRSFTMFAEDYYPQLGTFLRRTYFAYQSIPQAHCRIVIGRGGYPFFEAWLEERDL